jgi:APA family basic amino acid/polyamine antiporter
MSQPTREGLIRGIRRWDFVALVVNAIIGAGIFGLPSKVYGSIGSYSLIAFAVCALVVTLIILCFAEVGSRFETTGGPYLYAREAFGSIVGFEVGWLLWLARITAFAANCNLLINYLGFFWPPANVGAWRVIIISATVVLLTIINIVGVRNAAIFSNLFTVGKLIPLILFVAVGLFFVNTGNFSFSSQPNLPQLSYATFSYSVLLLVYAFTGFEMAVIPTGEVQNPQRSIPIGLLIAIGVVATLYILIQVVCIGTLPGLASPEMKAPLADAGNVFLGRAGASIISAGAIVSITGNLSLIILGSARIPFAMAEQGQLPRILASTHKRFHTPHLTTLLSAAVMLVVTISGTFIYALTISTIARLLAYASTCAALPKLRGMSDAPQARFKVPAGIIVSIAALVLAGWLLSNSGWNEARDAGIAAALGLLIYLAFKLSQSKARSFR